MDRDTHDKAVRLLESTVSPGNYLFTNIVDFTARYSRNNKKKARRMLNCLLDCSGLTDSEMYYLTRLVTSDRREEF